MKIEKSPVGRESLLGLICFFETDAINSGGETWTEYSIGVHTNHAYKVTEYHAYYNSNARLAKLRFRLSENVDRNIILFNGLLHGSSDYRSSVTYLYTGGGGNTVTRDVTVSTAGEFYATNSWLNGSGSNYIELIYPYYS